MTIRKLRPYIIAVGMTLPGLGLRFLHPDISPLLVALLSGLAILGASFLLTWACEVAQMDMPFLVPGLGNARQSKKIFVPGFAQGAPHRAQLPPPAVDQQQVRPGGAAFQPARHPGIQGGIIVTAVRHALGQQALPQRVVDFVRAQVVEVFTLQPYLRAAQMAAQIGAVEYRVGPPRVVRAKIVQFFLKGGISLGGHHAPQAIEQKAHIKPAQHALAPVNAVIQQQKDKTNRGQHLTRAVTDRKACQREPKRPEQASAPLLTGRIAQKGKKLLPGLKPSQRNRDRDAHSKCRPLFRFDHGARCIRKQP